MDEPTLDLGVREFEGSRSTERAETYGHSSRGDKRAVEEASSSSEKTVFSIGYHVDARNSCPEIGVLQRDVQVPNVQGETRKSLVRWTPVSRQKMDFLKVEKYTLRLVNRVRFSTGGTSTGVKLVRGLVPESLMKTLLVVKTKVGS